MRHKSLILTLLASLLAGSTALAQTPGDVTYLITNNHLENWTTNGSGGPADGWTLSSGAMNRKGTSSNYCVTNYGGTYDVNQTIEGLAAGVYKLKVQAFSRPDGNSATMALAASFSTIENETYIYGNDYSTKVKNITDEWFTSKPSTGEYSSPNNMYGVTVYIPNNGTAFGYTFSQGMYDNEVYTTVGTDGKLVLGIKNELVKSTVYTGYDNFRLEYIGSDGESEAAALIASIPEGKMFMDIKSALDAAKAAAETDASVENLNKLVAAIDAANENIKVYEQVKSTYDAAAATMTAEQKAQFAAELSDVLTAYNDGTLTVAEAVAAIPTVQKAVNKVMGVIEVFAELNVVDTKTTKFTSECGTGYVGQSQSLNLSEVLTLLGVSDMSQVTIQSVKADGSLLDELGTGGSEVGWRDANGDFITWANATWRCQAQISGTTIQFLKVSGHQSNGVQFDNTEVTYTARYVAYTGTKDNNKAVELDVNLSFVAAAVYSDLNNVETIDVNVESTVGKFHEGLTADVDVAAILAKHGVSQLSEVTIYAVQSDGKLDANYQLGSTDGWRNAAGDWQAWGSKAYICVKSDFSASEKQIYYVGGISGNTNTPATYTATFAFMKGTELAAGNDCVTLKVNLIYKEKEPAPVAYSDLKVADTKEINLYSETGYYYEGLTADVDIDAILTALGETSMENVTIYAVQSDGTLDDDYQHSGDGGYRDANGDWAKWGNEASMFYVQVNDGLSQITGAGGHQNHATHLTTPVTYTATYAFVVGNTPEDNKAVVLKVNLIYEYNKANLVVTAAKYATFVAPFDVTLPAGVKAYKVTGVTGTELDMEEVATTVPACTVVVLYSETPVNTVVEGLDIADQSAYTTGLLSAPLYEDVTAPAGTYVLQDQGEGAKFYLCEGTLPTVTAGHAYLTAPIVGVKAFGFDAIATAIAKIEAEKAEQAGIYNLQGQQLSGLQRGINIVNGKKVLVK